MSLDTEKIKNFFKQYGGYTTINANFDTENLTDNGPPGQPSFGTGSLSIEVDIRGYDDYIRLLQDLSLIDGLKEEEQLRTNSPTLQRAYDDYKLLIRLSK